MSNEPVQVDSMGTLDRDPPLESSLRNIASRVKRWREEAGMTLKELAGVAGVSASTVHKVENGQVSPTVSVLLRIAHGLDRPAVDLIASREDDLRNYLVTRAADRVRVRDHHGNLVEKAARDLSNPQIDLWRATIQPGAGSGRCVLDREGELIIYCEEGALVVWLDGEEVHLETGDSIHTKSSVARQWANRGDQVAVITIAVSVPRKVPMRASDRHNHVWTQTLDEQTRERRDHRFQTTRVKH